MTVTGPLTRSLTRSLARSSAAVGSDGVSDLLTSASQSYIDFGDGTHTSSAGVFSSLADKGQLGGTWTPVTGSYIGIEEVDNGGNIGVVGAWTTTTAPTSRMIWSEDVSSNGLFDVNVDFFLLGRMTGAGGFLTTFMQNYAGTQVLQMQNGSSNAATSGTGGTVTLDGSAASTRDNLYDGLQANISDFKIIRIADCPCTGFDGGAAFYLGASAANQAAVDFEIAAFLIANSADVDAAYLAALTEKRDALNA